MHKSTEWLQFVYLIKYHFVEMHGAWGWGRALQRLWGVCVGGRCADGAWGIETHALRGHRRHSVSVLLKVADSSGFFKQGLVNI